MKCILEIKDIKGSGGDDLDEFTCEIDVGDPLFAYEFAVARLWRNGWMPGTVSWTLTGPDGTVLAQENHS